MSKKSSTWIEMDTFPLIYLVLLATKIKIFLSSTVDQLQGRKYKTLKSTKISLL